MKKLKAILEGHWPTMFIISVVTHKLILKATSHQSLTFSLSILISGFVFYKLIQKYG